MADFKIVSRKDLYGEEEVISQNEQKETPPQVSELEIIEVNNTGQLAQEDDDEKQDVFEFPLFSFEPEETLQWNNNQKVSAENAENGDQTVVKLMKVTLGDTPYEEIKQERPKSYYFTSYNDVDHQNFAQVAIDADTIIKEAQLGPARGWGQLRGKLIDLREHNECINKILLREKCIKRRRPGKNQRLAKRLGAEREKERIEKAKEIRKQLKKKFHKRGGKKNKKRTEPLIPTNFKPKFRTE